ARRPMRLAFQPGIPRKTLLHLMLFSTSEEAIRDAKIASTPKDGDNGTKGAPSCPPQMQEDERRSPDSDARQVGARAVADQRQLCGRSRVEPRRQRLMAALLCQSLFRIRSNGTGAPPRSSTTFSIGS